MISKGATKAELENAFASIPNTLRTASYRAEIAAFDEIQEMLEETTLQDKVLEKSKKLAKDNPVDVIAKMKDALDTVDPYTKGLITEFDALVQQGLLMDKKGNFALDVTNFGNFDSADVRGIKNFNNTDYDNIKTKDGKAYQESASGKDTQATIVHGLSGKITSAFGFVQASLSVVEHMKTDTSVMDPVEKQMHEDKLFDVVSDSISATLQGGSNWHDLAKDSAKACPMLGLLGVVDKSKVMLENIVKTGAKRLNKNYDAYLQLAARAAGSALAGAFEESKKHEGFLRDKYAIKSLSSAAGIAADIMCAFPGTAMVGAITGAVNYLGTKIADARLNEVERSQIIKAKELLEKANQGDEIAKVELFKNHAMYAKGLIAYKAEQKDGFALSYVQQRGLSESAVAGSSKEIIMRYLLKKSEQSADQYEDQNLVRFQNGKALMHGAQRILGNISGFFKGSWWELASDNLIPEVEKFEDEILQLGPLNKQSAKTIQDLQQKQKGAADKRVEHLEKQIQQVEAYQKHFGELQAEGTKTLKDLMTKIAMAQTDLQALEAKPEESYKRGELRKKNGLQIIVPVATSSLKKCLLTLNSLS